MAGLVEPWDFSNSFPSNRMGAKMEKSVIKPRKNRTRMAKIAEKLFYLLELFRTHSHTLTRSHKMNVPQLSSFAAVDSCIKWHSIPPYFGVGGGIGDGGWASVQSWFLNVKNKLFEIPFCYSFVPTRLSNHTNELHINWVWMYHFKSVVRFHTSLRKIFNLITEKDTDIFGLDKNEVKCIQAPC